MVKMDTIKVANIFIKNGKARLIHDLPPIFLQNHYNPYNVVWQCLKFLPRNQFVIFNP